MVESTKPKRTLEADYRMALLIGYSSKGTSNPLPSVDEDLLVMENFIKTLGFDEIVVLKDDEATEQSVTNYFTRLAYRSLEHQEKNSGKKFLTITYYSGHGGIEFATLRVTLDDCVYPLELKIRQFKNEYPKNTYNIGVFDTCRFATRDPRHTVGPMK